MATASEKGGWLPYAGLIIAVVGIVYQGGGMSRDLDQARVTIADLQRHNADTDRERETRYREVTDRLTRIETKLDLTDTKDIRGRK